MPAFQRIRAVLLQAIVIGFAQTAVAPAMTSAAPVAAGDTSKFAVIDFVETSTATSKEGPDKAGKKPGRKSLQKPSSTTASAATVKPTPKTGTDLSGRKRTGTASFYANHFAGKKMADGERMDPTGNNAASKTLPLGTKAKVTNLETGKSAVVTIQDRGPYVDGRIVDLSPSTAKQVGITKQDGLAKVEVAPITVPMPDGQIKLGEAAGAPLPR